MLKQETGTDSTLASKLSSLESGCGSELGTGAPLSPPLDPAAFSAVSRRSGSAGAEAATEHRSGADLPLSYLSTGWAAGAVQPPGRYPVQNGQTACSHISAIYPSGYLSDLLAAVKPTHPRSTALLAALPATRC